MEPTPNAKLFFAVNLPFDITLNKRLWRLSSLKVWDREKKQYLYVFPMCRYEEVVSLTKPIFFDKKEGHIVQEHLQKIIGEKDTEPWKGKSGYTVHEQENVYVITTHQKPHKGGKVRVISQEIPKERVVRLWKELWYNLPEGEWYGYKYLARKTCEVFKLTRYFRPSGSFTEAKFQGSRNNAYFPYYYWPLKIMEYYGLVARRGQYLSRVKTEWEDQPTLQNK